MTKYEYLILKAGECYRKAKETNDVKLKFFYNSAYVGFCIKAEKLTLEEAGGEV